MKRTKRLYPIPETGVTMGYIEYLPEDYESGKDYPLVLFLHGYGERGNGDESQVEAVEVHGFPRYAHEGAEYPFVLIAPQCPSESVWPVITESLNFFLDHLLDTYRVDPDRVCLTGLSMGGTETWLWACGHSERFACLVPVCGAVIRWMAFTLKDIPIWAFHGTLDNCISCEESIGMVNDVNKAGGHADLTLYHGVGHDSWVPAYQDPALIGWICRQHR
ncbi:MAG: prolyl oligopeptidase family serine peptidase [Clostridia bacterium]|nr:prolyl oligopeptidase family serine peptidase [Clostridia bacterium]